MDEQQTPPPAILDAHGRDARRAESKVCPRCAAGAERRVLSAGFGAPHDVCGACGYDFPERTR